MIHIEYTIIIFFITFFTLVELNNNEINDRKFDENFCSYMKTFCLQSYHRHVLI